MRLIDGDLLHDNLSVLYKGMEPDKELILKCVESQPTVEAAVAKQAGLRNFEMNEIYDEFGDCSNCGGSNVSHAKFCNFCGAVLNDYRTPKEPMAFCVNCYCNRPYSVSHEDVEISVRGIVFSYDEITARCKVCNKAVYVPKINDANVKAREEGFKNHGL